MSWLVLGQIVATFYMAGLIWFVQVVHYPLGDLVGSAGFGSYQRAHVDRTGWVVAVPMVVEAIGAGSLVWQPIQGVPQWLGSVGFVLVVLIWVATGAASVPAHNRLLNGFDVTTHRFLVRSNWVRTLAWTGRAVLMIFLMSTLMEVA